MFPSRLRYQARAGGSFKVVSSVLVLGTARATECGAEERGDVYLRRYVKRKYGVSQALASSGQHVQKITRPATVAVGGRVSL